MSRAYARVVVQVGVDQDASYAVVDALRDHADENHLGWRVSRMGTEKVKVESTVDAGQLDNGSVQAMSHAVQEVEVALASLQISSSRPCSASVAWHGDDEDDE